MKNCLLTIWVVLLVLLVPTAKADLVPGSLYHLDLPDQYADAGPAAQTLTPIGDPNTVPGVSGEALSFVTTHVLGTVYNSQGAVTSDANNIDASLGLVVDFWYKGGADQTNSYPHLLVQQDSWQVNFQNDGSMMTLNFFGLDLGAGNGVIYHDLGSDTWDDQWHHYVATYDPVAGIMSGDLDDGTNYVEAAIVSGTINTGDTPVYIATNFYFGTQYDRGFNGEIDEVKIDVGTPPPYVWYQTSMYHMDDGDELLDSGFYANDLIEVGGPNEVTGYLGDCFNFNATDIAGDGLNSSDPYEIDLNTQGQKVDFWFNADSVQSNSFPHLVLQEDVWQINFQNDSAIIAYTIHGSFGGESYNTVQNDVGSSLWDGQWHHVVASYKPFNRTMELKIDDVSESTTIPAGDINVQSEKQILIGSESTSAAATRGFNGLIDEVEISTIWMGETLPTLTMLTPDPTGPQVTPAVGVYNPIPGSTVQISAEDPFADCPDVSSFDHWEGNPTEPNSAVTTVLMDGDKTVKAIYNLETPACGDLCYPNPVGDVTDDCRVDLEDLTELAKNWLVDVGP